MSDPDSDPDPARPRLVAEALAIAAAVRVALRLMPISRVAASLDRYSRLRTRDAASAGDCLRVAAAAAARVAHPTCLYRSLVAYALLARRGHAAALHLGVSRNDGFAAHAWISVAGRSCDPDASRSHVTLWSHSAAREA